MVRKRLMARGHGHGRSHEWGTHIASKEQDMQGQAPIKRRDVIGGRQLGAKCRRNHRCGAACGEDQNGRRSYALREETVIYKIHRKMKKQKVGQRAGPDKVNGEQYTL